MNASSQLKRTATLALPAVFWWMGGVLLVLALAAVGCKSPPPAGEGSLAWVEITNQPPKQIFTVAKAVFIEKGYKLADRPGPDLVFEKSGGFTTGLLHGGLDSGALLRVFVSLDKQSNGIWLLHCRADAVRDAGQGALEESQRLSRLHSGTFNSLLLEIQKRLAGP